MNADSKKLPACVQSEQLPFTNTELWTGYGPPIHAARTIYHRAEKRTDSTLLHQCRKPGRPHLRRSETTSTTIDVERPNLRSCLLRSSC